MQKANVVLALAVLPLAGLLLGAVGGEARDMEVTKNPGLLVSPAARVSDLTVYGVKLGDPVEKIPAVAGVTQQPSERLGEAVYTGRNVWYFAYQGKVYEIRILGDLIKNMPPYDSVRTQIALGKADETVLPEEGFTNLNYFGRHVQFTFRGLRDVAVIELYAP